MSILSDVPCTNHPHTDAAPRRRLAHVKHVELMWTTTTDVPGAFVSFLPPSTKGYCFHNFGILNLHSDDEKNRKQQHNLRHCVHVSVNQRIILIDVTVGQFYTVTTALRRLRRVTCFSTVGALIMRNNFLCASSHGDLLKTVVQFAICQKEFCRLTAADLICQRELPVAVAIENKNTDVKSHLLAVRWRNSYEKCINQHARRARITLSQRGAEPHEGDCDWRMTGRIHYR
ncbi:hypothetical protein F2P81_012950 [Scophthalmus maximus]|uniref:Uncharacterized protein n=1 Tax=Scophthalmus maximus TaxID=52904 RepID=A0A6A4SYU9_SCOMX|nr:hypothetical protein F2P81_012950 [Scophthalmus maximus]